LNNFNNNNNNNIILLWTELTTLKKMLKD